MDGWVKSMSLIAILGDHFYLLSDSLHLHDLMPLLLLSLLVFFVFLPELGVSWFERFMFK